MIPTIYTPSFSGTTETREQTTQYNNTSLISQLHFLCHHHQNRLYETQRPPLPPNERINDPALSFSKSFARFFCVLFPPTKRIGSQTPYSFQDFFWKPHPTGVDARVIFISSILPLLALLVTIPAVPLFNHTKKYF